MPTAKTYIRYGIPSDWAEDYEKKKISATTFKNTSKKNLNEKYLIPKTQIDIVKACLSRIPIDPKILQRLLERNRFTCCLCKGQKSDAYIIHHIIEYSQTQDNSYKNLAVLCPNDHDLAHREGISITNKISEIQIKTAKINWEAYVLKQNKLVAIKKQINKENASDVIPYKELQSYTEDDSDIFFGRKQEINELVLIIRKFNIVGLFGESGTGKTSLINAGLIPLLKNSNSDIIIVSVRCLDEPVKRIREELIRRLKENTLLSHAIEKLAECDTFPHFVVELRLILSKCDNIVFIIIDQFEELFTRASEEERINIAKGVNESLTYLAGKRKISFLFSLREDYIGELWEWSHSKNLEEAWIHQYRIKRLTNENAYLAISEPLNSLGVLMEAKFVEQLISDLKSIGGGYVYPPYLQIVCSKLFDLYKILSSKDSSIKFGFDLYKDKNAESIIVDYLSESMMEGLTEEEKYYSQDILDLLTGPEGLRTFLNIDEICKYLEIDKKTTLHILEHLIKKKIVHPITAENNFVTYELVHDFLSKRFFDKLGPEARRTKTSIDIFRRAYKEWKQHEVLASRDRLEILYPNVDQLTLDIDEWTFLIKSSFSVYWSYDNKWTRIIEPSKLKDICLGLLQDKEERIVENAINNLGQLKEKEVTKTFIEIINSPKVSISIRERAIVQYYFNIIDINIIEVLKNIIINEESYKLRKAAVYALGRNLYGLRKVDESLIEKNISIIHNSLNDSKTQIRNEAANILGNTLSNPSSVKPLIKRLLVESSINSRKSMVSALGSFLRKGVDTNAILTVLKRISSNPNEDYRVKEEAKISLEHFENIKLHQKLTLVKQKKHI